jgi:hypothetical protein
MANQRFLLDPVGHVIDTYNSNAKVHHYAVYDTSEKSLRESVVIRRVSQLVDKLLVNNQPLVEGPGGKPYQPANPENFSLAVTIFHAVKASHLNRRDVALSLKYRFEGRLHRDDVGWQDVTSISLFLKDVECLLRDLYGDFDDDDAIESIREAIFTIAEKFLQCTRNDLCLEHHSAVNIDTVCGIRFSEEMGISGSDHRRANQGVAYLFDRACNFRAKPDAFSHYTAKFVKELEEHPTFAPGAPSVAAHAPPPGSH